MPSASAKGKRGHRRKLTLAEARASGALAKNPQRYRSEVAAEAKKLGEAFVPAGRDYSAIAAEYVRGVLDGSTPACRYVRLACRRHIDDLSSGAYTWDAAAANAAGGFIEALVHVKGRWAHANIPLEQRGIRLEPWQCFVVASIFGWRTASGTRRYRETYLEIPRKNGKSILAAAIGLYMLVADGEAGSEVYCGATTEAQAWEVFRVARWMAEQSPGLAERYGIEVCAKALKRARDNSYFLPVIGQPGDGSSPHCAIADELHEHETDSLCDTFKTGMGAREQPLLLGITTAGINISGPCYTRRTRAIHILEGASGFDDPTLFACIWTIDDGDDWTTEAAWRKANPNYGVSVMADFLEAQRRTAMQEIGKQSVLKCKHLNIWNRVRTAWMDMAAWRRCERPITLDDFRGRRCWLGLDLASKTDIAALMLLTRHDSGYSCLGRYFLPSATIERPENEHYRRWRDAGILDVTDGEITDYDRIEEVLTQMARDVELASAAYDPFQATQLATHMTGAGLLMVEVPAQVRHMSEPMKEVDALVRAGRMHHGPDPALEWMMGNVVAAEDAKGNIYPRKEQARNSIDGVVALIMALARAIVEPVSPYETRDLTTV